jgi:hypothetical protein
MSDKKFKIYIIGKVTGMNVYDCADIFKIYEELIAKIGNDVEVFNPVRHVPMGSTWEDAMNICKPHLEASNMVFVLKSFKVSRGSLEELKVALESDKQIFYETFGLHEMIEWIERFRDPRIKMDQSPKMQANNLQDIREKALKEIASERGGL